jgi:hypothetical protein
MSLRLEGRHLRRQVVFSSFLHLASDVHLVMYRQLCLVHSLGSDPGEYIS